MIETGVGIRRCACPHIVAFLLVAVTTRSPASTGDHEQSDSSGTRSRHRTIQLAGYDVYYEDHDEGTRNVLLKGWRGRSNRRRHHKSSSGGDYGHRVYELHQ